MSCSHLETEDIHVQAPMNENLRIETVSFCAMNRIAAWLALIPYLPAVLVVAAYFDPEPNNDRQLAALLTYGPLYCSYATLYGALLVSTLGTGGVLWRVFMGVQAALTVGAIGLGSMFVVVILFALLGTSLGRAVSPAWLMFVTIVISAAGFGYASCRLLRPSTQWPRSDPAFRAHTAMTVASAALAASAVSYVFLFEAIEQFGFYSRTYAAGLVAVGFAGPAVHAFMTLACRRSEAAVHRPVYRSRLHGAVGTLMAFALLAVAAWTWTWHQAGGGLMPRRLASILTIDSPERTGGWMAPVGR
jgi:hypothetical protein